MSLLKRLRKRLTGLRKESADSTVWYMSTKIKYRCSICGCLVPSDSVGSRIEQTGIAVTGWCPNHGIVVVTYMEE